MNRSILSLTTIGLLFVALLFVNGISRSTIRNAQVDLTQDKLYSLSDGSKNILRSIAEPITVKYYFSRTDSTKYPSVQLYGNRIADLLKQYERASNGKLNLEVYDPRPDSEEEEWATKYGITPFPTQTGENLFIGLVAVNAHGEERAIPVFDFQRQSYLEYDITKTLFSLSKTKNPSIGILSSLDLEGKSAPADENDPEMAQQPKVAGPWFFLSQLDEGNDVQQVPVSAELIPAELNVLIVIHPKKLGIKTLYAIDQFVMRGGRLMVLEDPYAQADAPAANPQDPMAGMLAERSSSLNDLTKAWGVEMADKKVVADLQLSTPVSTSRGEEAKNFIAWVLAQKARGSFNTSDLVTNSLDTMMFPWAGSLTIMKKDGIVAEPLIHTTTGSTLLSDKDYRFNGGDPDALLRGFLADNTEKTLAVRISGKLPSAYGDKAPEGVDGKIDHLKESQGVGHVVVISDVDFLSDRYSVVIQNFFGTKVAQPLNDNQNFFLNAVENLSGSEDLISIRSRGGFGRPFEVVQDLEARAQQRWQLEAQRLEGELKGANERLKQLQGEMKATDGSKQVYDKALLDEIKGFRDQKSHAQRELRVVRRNLRQDIETLGSRLFFLNTFFIPLCLIGGYTFYLRTGRRSKRN